MWPGLGRPAANRETSTLVVDDIVTLVPNATEISSSVLFALLQAQVDLISKTGREACANHPTRAALAELAAQQLSILVREAENVPGETGEGLNKARLLLESVQKPDLEIPASAFAASNEFMAGESGGAPAPGGALGADGIGRRGTSTTQNAVLGGDGGSLLRWSLDWQPPAVAAEPPRYIEPVDAGPEHGAAFVAASGGSGKSSSVAASDGFVAVSDSELVAFVVDKVAAGATAFKANKLPQILAALVRDEFMQPAVQATRKALDPNLRGHIEVAAFVEWWPTSKFATPACENAWMKELNAEALRTRLMADALHKQVEAQQAAEAAAAADAERQRKAVERQASQPKRVQQVLARLRRAEAAVQEAHGAALREALVVIEELSDVQPQFLHDLHAQLAATSPLMAIARGGPFAQLVHHKARCQMLEDELEGAAAAELAAREAAAARVESYAVRAEAMHRRLHNRSASQAADWLRAGVKRANDSGQKVQARHLVENETKRVKAALQLMSEWLDGDVKKRIVALPTRFDVLARRALRHVTAQQVPQVAGGQQHRRSTARELSAHMARALDAQHVAEVDTLHAALEKLTGALQPRDAMPIDEHTQLLCAELWFRQRGQLGAQHALEHAAVPAVVRTFVDTLSGPAPIEDSAVARMRIGVRELQIAESFCAVVHSQVVLQQQLDKLHDKSRAARQGLTALASHVQNGGGLTDGCRATFLSLWKGALALSAQAEDVRAAIRDGVDATAQHLSDFELSELPRAQAMLEAATTIRKASFAIVDILSGEHPPSGEAMALGATAAAADAGHYGGGEQAGTREASPTPPDLTELIERWGVTAVSIQAEQQRLVAAAADMEQHALDMQGLLVERAEPVAEAMGRFVALVHPGRELGARAVDFGALCKACKTFEAALEELLQRALAPLALPEVFARMHGQLQQQKDSLNAWCYPLLKLKQEQDVAEAAAASASAVAVVRTAKGGAKKDDASPSPTEKEGKGAKDPKAVDGKVPGVKPPKGPKAGAPTTESARSAMLSPAAAAAPAPASVLPRGLPLPPSPQLRRKGSSFSGGNGDMLDPAVVSRVSLELMKTLLGSQEMKQAQRLPHESIVKRRDQAQIVVEKRRAEQQRVRAEVQALEQLLELSTVADSKGVPQASLEERVAVLAEAVNAADALAPKAPNVDDSKGKAAAKNVVAPEVEAKPNGKARTASSAPQKAPAPGGKAAAAAGKGSSAKAAAAAGKGSSAKATGSGKNVGDKTGGGKGKGSSKTKVGEEPTAVKTEESAKEVAAVRVQAVVRGHQAKRATRDKANAVKRVQALARGHIARRASAMLMDDPALKALQDNIQAMSTGAPPEAVGKKGGKIRDKSPAPLRSTGGVAKTSADTKSGKASKSKAGSATTTTPEPGKAKAGRGKTPAKDAAAAKNARDRGKR